jgi:tRNA threonylcarbamoyladenosine biosynthesis protein TsaE
VTASSERTSGPAETEAIGARLAAELQPGDVVLVRGELSAGKTTLIRGACRALGVTQPVTSPTFTIGRRYRGRVPVSHLDLYRVDSLADEDPGLLDDYLTPDAIAFVEWPGAAEPELGGERRIASRVVLEHAGGDRRRVRVEADAARSRWARS